MRKLSLFSIAALVLTMNTWASSRSDSLLAFTGARTKAVWLRYTWCNTDFSPKTKAQAEAAGVTVMLFDTDEGTERALGTGLTTVDQSWNQGQVRISRSGRWVTVADDVRTYIFDLSGTNPNKRVFLDKSTCTYWTVKAWGRDAATGAEYVYTLDNFDHSMSTYAGTAMYRIPVNADGTANIAGAIKIPVNGSPKIDGSFSVSADMKKIGGLFPWGANPAILDAATGTMLQRKNGASCHTNIAADNSYRFFHLDDDHIGIYMWDKDLSTSNWYITLKQGSDFWCPRWSNDVRFIASTPWSLVGGDEVEMGQHWGWSAATVKAKPLGTVWYCLLLKLSADFKSIEKTFPLTQDIRNFDYQPDIWTIAGYTGGPVVTAKPSLTHSSAAPLQRILRSTDGAITVRARDGSIVRAVDYQGRSIAQNGCGLKRANRNK